MYRIEVHPRALKELAKVPRQEQLRIRAAIKALTADPRPAGCVPVKGAEKGMYRIRVGSYRVAYIVEDDPQRVIVARVGHRKSVYRNLN